MNDIKETIKKSISDFFGLELSLHDHTILMTLPTFQEFHLELPKKGELILLHSQLFQVNSLTPSEKEYQQWLALNGEQHRLQGTWVNFHSSTQSLRLFLTLPIETITSDLIPRVIQHFIDIHRTLMEHIRTEPTWNA